MNLHFLNDYSWILTENSSRETRWKEKASYARAGMMVVINGCI